MEAAATLYGRLPEAYDADAVLERFVEYAESLGLELYPAQEEAILELLSGHHVVLNTPTGSGKSLVATALHFKALAEGKVSFYTSPIKALANEKFFALCEAFGPERVGLMTGDAAINADAPIICCTAEVLANMALRGDRQVDYAVLDEFHYYADRDRGVAWQLPLLTLKDTTFLLMSATLGNMAPIAEPLEAFTGREVAVVTGAERPVPLSFVYSERPLHEVVPQLVEAGEAPVYLVNFTQKACAEEAQNLMSVDFSSKEEKRALGNALRDTRFDTPQGKELQRFLRHGIGIHHAGLLPKYRRLVERLAQRGLLKVISGTDTLGVGVNIPIRTVLLTKLSKFDGEKVRHLTVREFLQVAGRAGRKGFDDHGNVVALAPEHVIENLRIEQKIATRPELKKKLQKKKPPQGFVSWGKDTFDRLSTQPPEALESRFEVTHGMILELLQASEGRRDGGWARLLGIIDRSHERDVEKRRHRRDAARLMRSLRRAGIVELARTPEGGRLSLSGELQEDFSLNHTLGLYLLEVLGVLDPDSETYALDVLSFVEAILEDPRVVLYKQVDVLKGDLIARLKAEGMDYEDRMEELKKVEYPKPNAELVYGTFDDFAVRHPWAGENIRPKSVAREMFENLYSFNDYVNVLGLARFEGVLLRYLSDAYKTLQQSVPESFRDETVVEILAFLRETVRRVDASLLEEWERMAGLAPSAPAAEPEAPPRPVDPAADPRAFAARIRTELHRLLKALDLRDGEAVRDAVYQGEEAAWPDERLQEVTAPYFAEHAGIVLTPQARQPRNTSIHEVAPRLWDVRQTIVDPEGEEDWSLVAQVDLREERDFDLPLIELLDVRSGF